MNLSAATGKGAQRIYGAGIRQVAVVLASVSQPQQRLPGPPLPSPGSQCPQAARELLPDESGDQSGYSESIPEFIRRLDWLRPAKTGMVHVHSTAAAAAICRCIGWFRLAGASQHGDSQHGDSQPAR